MKLITNSAEIKVTENEDGSKSFQGIGSEVGVENLNGIILTPNCIEFARERYPLLYEHGSGSSEVIGDAKVYYDLASNKYLTDFTLYDNAPNINKAVENGAFDSLSIAYYITDYEFNENDALVVNKAQFKEISLVSVPADPNAKFIQNALGEELTEEQKRALAVIKKGRDGLEVKPCDKVRALELLGKHLGMFTDKIEANINDSVKNELAELLAQRKARGEPDASK